MQLIEYKLPWQPKYRTVIDFKKKKTLKIGHFQI